MAVKLIRHFDKGVELESEEVELTPEEAEDEAERIALERVDEIIDGITSLAQARVFLKRLCKRLVRKGILP